MKRLFKKRGAEDIDVRLDAVGTSPHVNTEGETSPPKKKITYTRLFIRDFLEIALCTAIPIILFTKVLMLSICPSPSMSPTIPVGEIYVASRWNTNDVQPRGTIITFWDRDHTQNFCKRIIGVPGDTLSIYEGKVYINGEELDESAYLEPGVYTTGNIEISIPKGRYFVMGDNRDNSYDSRDWLFPLICQEDITGVYLCGVCIPILGPALAGFVYTGGT